PALAAEERLPGADGTPTTERIPVHSPPPAALIDSLIPRSPRLPRENEAELEVPSAPPPSPPQAPALRGLASRRPSVSGRYSLSPEVEAERVPALSSSPVAGAARTTSEPRMPEVRLPDPRPTFDSRPEIQAALDLSATFVGQDASGEQALYDALRRGS